MKLLDRVVAPSPFVQRDDPQCRHRCLGKSPDDEIAQLGLRCDVLVDGGVTHAQRAGDIDDRRLRRTEPANDVFGRGKDPLAR